MNLFSPHREKRNKRNKQLALNIILNGKTSNISACNAVDKVLIDESLPNKEAFIQKIGGHNVATLKEMEELHLYDFGIFIEMAPDDEQKQMLEQNIQMALSKGSIDLDDAIDIREVKNIKTANQVLKIRKGKKFQRDQLAKQQNRRQRSSCTGESNRRQQISQINHSVRQQDWRRRSCLSFGCHQAQHLNGTA